jgi:uncharacterized protein
MKNTLLTAWENRFFDYLLQHAGTDDASHDLDHFKRVWRRASEINEREGGTADPLVLLTAAYFHDLVSLPKNHPDRNKSSVLSAEKTADILRRKFSDFPEEKIAAVAHAIEAHSFSANIPPQSMEAKILQDADRMEALGAIGIARVFYVAGRLNTLIFDPADPLATEREPDDKRYALDHFKVKLLRLPALMNTISGKDMAEEHAAYLMDFMERISAEIRGDSF